MHGDHGSRIFQHPPKGLGLDPLDDRQLNGRFSTFLVARRPGVPASVNPVPVPVQDFVWRLAQQNFAGPVSTDFDHFVRVSSSNSVVVDSIRRLRVDSMPWSR